MIFDRSWRKFVRGSPCVMCRNRGPLSVGQVKICRRAVESAMERSARWSVVLTVARGVARMCLAVKGDGFSPGCVRVGVPLWDASVRSGAESSAGWRMSSDEAPREGVPIWFVRSVTVGSLAAVMIGTVVDGARSDTLFGVSVRGGVAPRDGLEVAGGEVPCVELSRWLIE